MARRSIPEGEPRPPRPLLLFDGDCGFCRRWVARWRRSVGEAADFSPAQEAQVGWLSAEDTGRSVWLLAPDGSAYGGAEAVLRLLALRPGGGGLLALYRFLPGFALLADAAYGWVARHRVLASKVSRALAGAVEEPPAFALARRVFLALLGLSYVSAFASFAVQARGLIGEQGVWPFPELLRWAGRELSLPALRIPSLLWLWPTDAGLMACCVAGLAAGLLLMAGRWPRAAALAAYALYLSLVSTGGLFFSYQWDVLLLEVGFLAIFIASRARPPPAVGLFLARVTLFRLMFLSGMVKLASGDPTWRALRGLQYHYWTQPLPTWSAYLADLLPLWADQACEAAMFGIELGAPFLLFGPRRVRHLGVALIAFLQLCIAATGNYGFFNLLALCLCALQVDDSVWRRLPLVRRRAEEGAQAALPRARWALAGWAALASLLLLLGWVDLWGRLRRGAEWPAWVEALDEWTSPFHAANGYGLFAVMTTERDEIDLAGSADGNVWRSYRFHYKPGPLDARPRFGPLHMPRLDWQMWFASLGACAENQWLISLQQGLLEGRPAVRALFAEDPFPDAPPRYLRTRIAPYRFAPFAELRARGSWWTRGPDRVYCPTLTLHDGRLEAVPGG